MDLTREIYKRFSVLEESKRITVDQTKTFEVESKTYQEAISDIEKRLEIKLRSGKCSRVLINQLARHQCNLGEVFVEKTGDTLYEKIEFYNSSELCDLIELVEQKKRNGDDFNGSVLKGFSKIHHGAYSSNGYSTVRNIKEFWFTKNGRIRLNLENRFQEILEEYEIYSIAEIMNQMHSIAMIDRSRNNELKGEWLVYSKVGARNYYLCLATHKEGDDNIWKNRIKPCLLEFPELKL